MTGSCLSFASLYGSFLRRSVVAAGLTSQNLQIDGETTIHFWGPLIPEPSKPSLVLVHGFGPAGIWQWRPQATFFAPRFNVYVPDLVFFGESFSNSSERSEVFQGNCVAKLLEKLGVSRYSLIGTSYGGFVSYRIAEMWPERVEKVVIASSAVNLRLSDNLGLMRRGKAKNMEELLLPATAAQLRTVLRLTVHRFPYMPEFLLNDFIEKLYMENRKEKSELLEGLSLGNDENVIIPPLSQDVLIIWGDQDQIFLLEKTTELLKLAGEKARLEVIKNTGHTPHLENASQFNKIVSNFLSNGIIS